MKKCRFALHGKTVLLMLKEDRSVLAVPSLRIKLVGEKPAVIARAKEYLERPWLLQGAQDRIIVLKGERT